MVISVLLALLGASYAMAVPTDRTICPIAYLVDGTLHPGLKSGSAIQSITSEVSELLKQGFGVGISVHSISYVPAQAYANATNQSRFFQEFSKVLGGELPKPDSINANINDACLVHYIHSMTPGSGANNMQATCSPTGKLGHSGTAADGNLKEARDQLIRVLRHELGHAFGAPHDMDFPDRPDCLSAPNGQKYIMGGNELKTFSPCSKETVSKAFSKEERTQCFVTAASVRPIPQDPTQQDNGQSSASPEAVRRPALNTMPFAGTLNPAGLFSMFRGIPLLGGLW